MPTDIIGRKRHFVTCRRCGNAGPPEKVWSKKRGRYVLTCMWCLDKLRRRIARRRLDAGNAD